MQQVRRKSSVAGQTSRNSEILRARVVCNEPRVTTDGTQVLEYTPSLFGARRGRQERGRAKCLRFCVCCECKGGHSLFTHSVHFLCETFPKPSAHKHNSIHAFLWRSTQNFAVSHSSDSFDILTNKSTKRRFHFIADNQATIPAVKSEMKEN